MTTTRRACLWTLVALVTWLSAPFVAASDAKEASPCSEKVVDLTDPQIASGIEAAAAEAVDAVTVAKTSASVRVSRVMTRLRDRSGDELIVVTECTLNCSGPSCTGSGCDASATGCSAFTCSGSGCSGSCTKKSTYTPAPSSGQ